MFDAAIPLIKEVLQKSGETRIIDIASGAGGSMLSIGKKLKEEIPGLRIVLSDYYPNIPAYVETVKQHPEIFSFVAAPVDACAVPKNLKGLRTHFLSLHHFKPEMAKKIIQDAIENNAPIAFFEAQERSLQHIMGVALAPLFVFLLTPFIKPFSLRRLFFTYALPVLPLFVLWDGMVSCLRTYSEREMHQLILEVPDHQLYDWKIARLKKGHRTMLYLLGAGRNI